MNDYRAYTIGEDGHIMSGEAFQAADDLAAVAHAMRFVTHLDVEVWQGGRKVGVLRGEKPA
jgi:hypothetical protein